MIGDLSSRPRHSSPEPIPDPEGLAEACRLQAERTGERLLAALRRSDQATLADQIAVTEIPAPPFQEGRRAAWMRDRFEAAGLSEVGLDPVGNVIGVRTGSRPGASPILLSAHLDTVFPHGTSVEVHRDQDRLQAPGISDDGRGLAALLAILRVLQETGTPTAHPLHFVATVGEEGLGDLRGVRQLCTQGGGRDALSFISLDGAGIGRVVTAGVGSRRYRMHLHGPGGHSWVDWGRPNPIAVVASALSRIPSASSLPPATTWSAGRIGGGTSVNAIPEESWVEVEVRAERAEDLDHLDAELLAAFDDALREANGGQPDDQAATLRVERIGDRPAGSTPADHPLVRAAVAATRALNLPIELATSSTDANLPMSLGIPAITLGAGGEAGGAHTLGEWYRNTRGPEGIYRALATVLLLDRWTDQRTDGATNPTQREAAD